METNVKSLEIDSYAFPLIWNGTKGALIELLKKAGLTVRFYDPEEKIWMDQSTQYGLTPAPGNRDGTWGVPSLEIFEKDYLNAV